MMRRVRKLVWPHHERLLALVMLPAFFLATLPHTFCVCGDGHREVRCNAAACLAIKQGDATGVCCGCTCCPSGKSGKSCCSRQAKLARSGSKQCPLHGWSAKHGNCCTPTVDTPAPLRGVVKISHAPQLDLALGEIQSPILADAAPPRIARRALDYHGPPPLDAVIVFLRLTI